MSTAFIQLQRMLDVELARTTELSTCLGAMITAMTQSALSRILAEIDLAIAEYPDEAAQIRSFRAAVEIMRDFDPLSVANENHG